MSIKVCFVILGIDFSGAENVLYQYLDGNSDIDPFFVFIYKGKAYEKFTQLKGKECCIQLDIPYCKNVLRFFPWIAQRMIGEKLIQTVDKIYPDVIYANNTLETMLCGNVVKKLKIPAFGHIHDMRDSYGTPMKVKATEKAFQNYTKIFTVSEACKASWCKQSLEVVYNGIPSKYYSDQICKKENKTFTVGYVGMISKRKGSDMLFDVIQRNTDYEWHIAYNIVQDDMEHYVETAERLPMVDIVKNIKADDMLAFYDGIDLLVIPSRHDPLPTVAIEAMARHKLVIGFRVGGVPELIGDERLIINGISSIALERKITEIMGWSKEQRKEISEAMHDRAKKMFSLEKKRKTINQTLKDAVDNANKVIK